MTPSNIVSAPNAANPIGFLTEEDISRLAFIIGNELNLSPGDIGTVCRLIRAEMEIETGRRLAETPRG